LILLFYVERSFLRKKINSPDAHSFWPIKKAKYPDWGGNKNKEIKG